MRKEKENTCIDDPKYKKILLWIVCLFLLVNTLKVTLFNLVMMENANPGSFFYKFLVSAIVVGIVFSLLILANKKVLWYLFYIVQVIYIGGFLCYYDYFNSIFHLFQLATLFPEGAAVVEHFSIPFQLNMLLSIIDLPLFVYLMIQYKKVTIREFFVKKKKEIFAGFIGTLVMIELINVFVGMSFVQLVNNYPKNENVVVSRYGTMINSIYDYIFNADGKGLLKLYDYGKDIANQKEKEKPMNILMIQVESLDANIIHKKYQGQYIAPFLSSMADNNIYHRRMMSYHLAGGTSDAEYTIMNSVHPLTSFPSMKLKADKYPNSIVKIFDKAGYETNGFHGNIGSFYNRTDAYKHMGFDEFYDIDKMGIKDAKWGASDEEVFNFAYDVMKKQKQPFFNYIVTMTSHTPFKYVDDYTTIHDFDSIETEGRRQYYKSVRYVDTQIEKLVKKVQKLAPNTCIFIYGDHTPGDLNDYEKSSYVTETDYFEFVPLIIITPEKIKYTNIKYAVSFLDLAPTALDFSGIKYNIKSKGESLLPCTEPLSLIPFKNHEYSREALIKNEQIYKNKGN